MQSIPIEIGGIELEAGEFPYLGGYRLTSDELDFTIQVVNVYVGGCYHNAVVWELTVF